jgi:hypothetical protein
MLISALSSYFASDLHISNFLDVSLLLLPHSPFQIFLVCLVLRSAKFLTDLFQEIPYIEFLFSCSLFTQQPDYRASPRRYLCLETASVV